jgi:hypothetical protein
MGANEITEGDDVGDGLVSAGQCGCQFRRISAFLRRDSAGRVQTGTEIRAHERGN